eukprot:scaffold1790_cov73-Phaeocystis_antarctica.AAC.3
MFVLRGLLPPPSSACIFGTRAAAGVAPSLPAAAPGAEATPAACRYTRPSTRPAACSSHCSARAARVTGLPRAHLTPPPGTTCRAGRGRPRGSRRQALARAQLAAARSPHPAAAHAHPLIVPCLPPRVVHEQLARVAVATLVHHLGLVPHAGHVERVDLAALLPQLAGSHLARLACLARLNLDLDLALDLNAVLVLLLAGRDGGDGSGGRGCGCGGSGRRDGGGVRGCGGGGSGCERNLGRRLQPGVGRLAGITACRVGQARLPRPSDRRRGVEVPRVRFEGPDEPATEGGILQHVRPVPGRAAWPAVPPQIGTDAIGPHVLAHAVEALVVGRVGSVGRLEEVLPIGAIGLRLAGTSHPATSATHAAH